MNCATAELRYWQEPYYVYLRELLCDLTKKSRREKEEEGA